MEPKGMVPAGETSASPGGSESKEVGRDEMNQDEDSLLFEAQNEVATLRTELYATRRTAYESKTGKLAAEE